MATMVDTVKNHIETIKANLKNTGVTHIEINAGELGVVLGFYNRTSDHALRSVIKGMKNASDLKNDTIINGPPSGFGASVTIRYKI